MAWFNPSWINRKKITVQNGQVAGDLTDFPVLLNVTDTEFSAARADGFDFVITKADGTTEVPYERERWIDATGELVLWFKGDILDLTDVDFFIYYNNSGQATDKADPTNVWIAAFQGVWHLNGDFLDSTSNNNDGTNTGTTAVAGKIADGRDFVAASSQSIDVGDIAALDSVSRITFSCWCSPDALTGNKTPMRKVGATNPMRMRMEVAQVRSELGTGDGITSGLGTAAGVFGYWAMVFDGTLSGNANRLKYYFNGVQETLAFGASTVPATTEASTQPLTIGQHEFWDGLIDEVRCTNTALTSDWLLTEFNNQNAPGSFVVYGAEETDTGGLIKFGEGGKRVFT